MEYHNLYNMHSYLMKKGIPFNDVSVIYRPQDLGYHCIFNESIRDLVTQDIINVMENNFTSLEYNIDTPFTYSFVKRK